MPVINFLYFLVTVDEIKILMNKIHKNSIIYLLSFILTAVAGLISSISLLGHNARLVDILMIFASGFAAGSSLTAFLKVRKMK